PNLELRLALPLDQKSPYRSCEVCSGAKMMLDCLIPHTCQNSRCHAGMKSNVVASISIQQGFAF
ncbi:MAG TPA: hypothetical protein VIJ01_14285, partial [Candidatus Angelobacter sp.]